MSLFTNLSTVKLRTSTERLKAGNYLVRIDKVKYLKDRLSVDRIFIEFTVLAVLSSSEGPPFHSVGEEAAQSIKVSGNEYAKADWATFCAGMFECKVEQLDSPEVMALTGNKPLDEFITNEDPAKGPVQILRGDVAEVQSRTIMTKDKTSTGGAKSHPMVVARKWRKASKEEVLRSMTPDLVARFFPGDSLNRLT